jgi:hypothetical protein
VILSALFILARPTETPEPERGCVRREDIRSVASWCPEQGNDRHKRDGGKKDGYRPYASCDGRTESMNDAAVQETSENEESPRHGAEGFR